ncbi:MAG: glycine cleavage system protein GcvH [Deltaproteobacteria bacterium]|nr:glycine cleavage system protein GcvH [Deltaproteobacteria bacterium]
MGNYPGSLKYTKDHEWARAEGSRYVIGITDHAQAELGEVVFVDLPEVGKQVTAGKPFGAAESTKAASDLFAPVTGKVVKANEALKADPSALNSDPYGAGWLVELEPTDGDTSHLMDADSYVKLLG